MAGQREPPALCPSITLLPLRFPVVSPARAARPGQLWPCISPPSSRLKGRLESTGSPRPLARVFTPPLRQPPRGLGGRERGREGRSWGLGGGGRRCRPGRGSRARRCCGDPSHLREGPPPPARRKALLEAVLADGRRAKAAEWLAPKVHEELRKFHSKKPIRFKTAEDLNSSFPKTTQSRPTHARGDAADRKDASHGRARNAPTGRGGPSAPPPAGGRGWGGGGRALPGTCSLGRRVEGPQRAGVELPSDPDPRPPGACLKKTEAPAGKRAGTRAHVAAPLTEAQLRRKPGDGRRAKAAGSIPSGRRPRWRVQSLVGQRKRQPSDVSLPVSLLPLPLAKKLTGRYFLSKRHLVPVLSTFRAFPSQHSGGDAAGAAQSPRAEAQRAPDPCWQGRPRLHREPGAPGSLRRQKKAGQHRPWRSLRGPREGQGCSSDPLPWRGQQHSGEKGVSAPASQRAEPAPFSSPTHPSGCFPRL